MYFEVYTIIVYIMRGVKTKNEEIKRMVQLREHGYSLPEISSMTRKGKATVFYHRTYAPTKSSLDKSSCADGGWKVSSRFMKYPVLPLCILAFSKTTNAISDLYT